MSFACPRKSRLEEIPPYHHGDLRTGLIEAAERLLRDHGSWTFTLREVARAAGVSHNAPYNHFEDRSALLSAVTVRAFAALKEALAAAIKQAGGSTTVVQIEAAATAYVLFAVAQPARFRLMFSADTAQSALADVGIAAEAAFGELKSVITQGVAEGALRPDPLDMHALSAWSLVHGLSGLIIDRRIAVAVDSAAIADLARAVGATLIDGLKAR